MNGWESGGSLRISRSQCSNFDKKYPRIQAIIAIYHFLVYGNYNDWKGRWN